MNKETIEMLKRYGLSEFDMHKVMESMMFSFLILTRAADEFKNKNNTLLYNSCG